MKLLEIIKFSEEYLKKYSFSNSRLESEKLISYVLGIKRIDLYTNFEMELTFEEKDGIKKLLREMARKRKTFDEIIKLREELTKENLNSKEKLIKNLENKNSETEYEVQENINQKNYRDENLMLLNKSINYLKKYNVMNSRLDAEYIFGKVLGVKRNAVTLHFNEEITKEQKDKLREYLIRRGKKREPLQYILKEWEFYGYPIKVDTRCLIPRADTEILVEQCINLMSSVESPKIMEIGAGSGAVSIALSKEIKGSSVLAIDISDEALSLAVENRELNEATNLKFLKSDVFKNVKDKNYDLILSNPPYIPQEEYEELMPEVKIYEPKIALTDGQDGYYFYEKISRESVEYLKDGGFLAFEVGYNQAVEVSELMKKSGFTILGIVSDYGNIPRVVIGRKS